MKRTLAYSTYYDKVLGGWIGKCAGGILGAPIEGYKRFNDIVLSDKLFETNFPNDDLDLQVLWLDMVKQKGPLVREHDFAEHWRTHVRFPWGEYGVAHRNLLLGLDPPDSGLHNNHYWYRGMGSPIRSELWGMLCAGVPEQAAYYAQLDSSLDHGAFSTDAERFLSACAAEAFFSDDLKTIFQQALTLFPVHSDLHQLVTTVTRWSEECSYEVVMRKIKGLYGDADFTSAPMNVAFTILALLRSAGNFDGIMDALHMGHDSDCIVATTGALLGIVIGYEKLPPRWKELVGDELLVSAEIIDIDHAHTISGLAEQTCRAGIPFFTHLGKVSLENAPTDIAVGPAPRFRLNVTAPDHYASFVLNKPRTLTLTYENLTDATQQVRIEVQSDDLTVERANVGFASAAHTTTTEPLHYHVSEAQVAALSHSDDPVAAFRYQLTVFVNDEQVAAYEKGIPFYGTWLLLGPFIQDAPELEPMDPDYPDHGMASLPSFQYMNHDKMSVEQDFLTLDAVRQLAQEKNYAAQPFLVQEIYPTGYKINLNQYYYGRGERSLYLYTKLRRQQAQKLWVALGCSALCRVWINGELMHEQKKSRRAWPYATTLLASLQEGENDLLVRIDTPVDHVDFEIGFKDFDEKHPHQSFWNTDLVPFV